MLNYFKFSKVDLNSVVGGDGAAPVSQNNSGSCSAILPFSHCTFAICMDSDGAQMYEEGRDCFFMSPMSTVSALQIERGLNRYPFSE